MMASLKTATRGTVTSRSKCWKPRASTRSLTCCPSCKLMMIWLMPIMKRRDMTALGVLKRLCRLGAESKSAPYMASPAISRDANESRKLRQQFWTCSACCAGITMSSRLDVLTSPAKAPVPLTVWSASSSNSNSSSSASSSASTLSVSSTAARSSSLKSCITRPSSISPSMATAATRASSPRGKGLFMSSCKISTSCENALELTRSGPISIFG
mmetsp:Transcript_23567/g.42568  ORF Transcript_23567/g.42568 Transcript_23567/m.42568 type:complete len:213 (+) Transcript_23567:3179-3817(+)